MVASAILSEALAAIGGTTLQISRDTGLDPCTIAGWKYGTRTPSLLSVGRLYATYTDAWPLLDKALLATVRAFALTDDSRPARRTDSPIIAALRARYQIADVIRALAGRVPSATIYAWFRRSRYPNAVGLQAIAAAYPDLAHLCVPRGTHTDPETTP